MIDGKGDIQPRQGYRQKSRPIADEADEAHHFPAVIIILRRLHEGIEGGGQQDGIGRVIQQKGDTPLQKGRRGLIGPLRHLELGEGGKLPLFQQLLRIAAVQHGIQIHFVQLMFHLFQNFRPHQIIHIHQGNIRAAASPRFFPLQLQAGVPDAAAGQDDIEGHDLHKGILRPLDHYLRFRLGNTTIGEFFCGGLQGKIVSVHQEDGIPPEDTIGHLVDGRNLSHFPNGHGFFHQGLQNSFPFPILIIQHQGFQDGFPDGLQIHKVIRIEHHQLSLAANAKLSPDDIAAIPKDCIDGHHVLL